MTGISDKNNNLNEKLKLCKKTYINYLKGKKFVLDVNIALEEMFADVFYISSKVNIQSDKGCDLFSLTTYSCRNYMNDQFCFDIQFKLIDLSGGFYGVEITMPCLKKKTSLDTPIYFNYNLNTSDLFMFITEKTSLDSAMTQSMPIKFQSLIELIHHEIITYFMSNVKHTFYRGFYEL